MLPNAHEHETDSGAVVIEEQSVQEYLDSFMDTTPSTTTESNVSGNILFGRVVCCESSRSLYCQDCCRLLVPDHSVPAPISSRRRGNSEGDKSFDYSGGRPLVLPFNLHIILDDRRGSATGLHAVVLMNGTDDMSVTHYASKDTPNTEVSNVRSSTIGSVKLVDLATDEIPKSRECDDSAFLLFPSPGVSVPLESVASKVRTLVVLDCKWTKSKLCRTDEDLSSLPKVHLSSPPEKSFYWRWHNAGPGMLSTIEAIYYAAVETMRIKHKLLLDAGQISQSDSRNLLIDRNNLIHLLWLFGHQRAATFKSAEHAGILAPGTDEGKEMQRAMRKQKGTWRQLRHKEDERRLNERIKLKASRNKI